MDDFTFRSGFPALSYRTEPKGNPVDLKEFRRVRIDRQN